MNLRFWEKETSDDKKVNNLPTQTVLIIRAVVGAYLLYTAYQLFVSKDTSMERWAVMIFVVVFVIFGVFVIGLTVYLYAKGLYVGGKADVEIVTEDTEDSSDEESAKQISDEKFSTEGAIDAEVKEVEPGENVTE